MDALQKILRLDAQDWLWEPPLSQQEHWQLLELINQPTKLAVEAQQLGRDADEVQQKIIAYIEQVFLNEKSNYYQVLGLEPQASAEQIRQHYRLLIALFHPDRHPDKLHHASRLNQAYAVLKNPHKKRNYDTQKIKPVRPAYHYQPPPSPNHKHRKIKWLVLISLSFILVVILFLLPEPAMEPQLVQTIPEANMIHRTLMDQAQKEQALLRSLTGARHLAQPQDATETSTNPALASVEINKVSQTQFEPETDIQDSNQTQPIQQPDQTDPKDQMAALNQQPVPEETKTMLATADHQSKAQPSAVESLDQENQPVALSSPSDRVPDEKQAASQNDQGLAENSIKQKPIDRPASSAITPTDQGLKKTANQQWTKKDQLPPVTEPIPSEGDIQPIEKPVPAQPADLAEQAAEDHSPPLEQPMKKSAKAAIAQTVPESTIPSTAEQQGRLKAEEKVLEQSKPIKDQLALRNEYETLIARYIHYYQKGNWLGLINFFTDNIQMNQHQGLPRVAHYLRTLFKQGEHRGISIQNIHIDTSGQHIQAKIHYRQNNQKHQWLIDIQPQADQFKISRIIQK